MEKETGLLAFGLVQAYLPFNSWKMVFGKTDVTQITLQAESEAELNAMGKKATGKLNTLHNTEDAYQVINMEEIAQGVGQIT